MPEPHDVLYIPKKSKASWESITNEIGNFLEPEQVYSPLGCEVRKAMLLYVIDKDEPRAGAKSTNINDICAILKKYGLDCEENENLRNSIGSLTGQIGNLHFIGGSGWKKHYFLSRIYDENDRDAVRKYVGDYRCSEM